MTSPVLTSGRQVAGDGRGGVEVIARDVDGAADLARLDERAQEDHLPPFVAHLELVDVLDAVAELVLRLEGHLPVAAELVVVGDVERAQIRPQRLRDVLLRDAERVGLGAVDVDEELRRVRAELGGDAGQAGLGLQLADERVGLLLQGVQAQAAAVLDHQLEAAGDAQAGDRRRSEGDDLGVLDLAGPGRPHAGHDRVGAQVGAWSASRTDRARRTSRRSWGCWPAARTTCPRS